MSTPLLTEEYDDTNMGECSSDGYSTEEISQTIHQEENFLQDDNDTSHNDFFSFSPGFTLGKDTLIPKKFARPHSETRDKTPIRRKSILSSSDRVRKYSSCSYSFLPTITESGCEERMIRVSRSDSVPDASEPEAPFQNIAGNSLLEVPNEKKKRISMSDHAISNDLPPPSLLFPPLNIDSIDSKENSFNELTGSRLNSIPSSKFVACKPSTDNLSGNTFKLGLRRTVSDIGSPSPSMVPPKTNQRKTISYNATVYDAKLPSIRKNGCDFISVDVVVDLLQGKYSHHFDDILIVDCRYTYEFEGGHIPGAISILPAEREDQLYKRFMRNPKYSDRLAIIFHCEFSSKRGPATWKRLRELDRLAHGYEKHNQLYYPYCYVMDGGYQNFYQAYPDICEGFYIEMKDKRFKQELSDNKKMEKKISRSRSVVVQRRREPLSTRTHQSLSFSQQ